MKASIHYLQGQTNIVDKGHTVAEGTLKGLKLQEHQMKVTALKMGANTRIGHRAKVLEQAGTSKSNFANAMGSNKMWQGIGTVGGGVLGAVVGILIGKLVSKRYDEFEKYMIEKKSTLESKVTKNTHKFTTDFIVLGPRLGGVIN